jgi:predicted RND superfamily exporter protein
MDRIAQSITRYRKPIIAVFVAAALVCAALTTQVGVNYNMADYLPPEAQSTRGLEIMTEEFGTSMPNTEVMVKDLSIQQAIDYKAALAALDGVAEVIWLDDTIDIAKPLEMADQDTVEGFYKDGTALFSVTVEEGLEQEAITAIRELVGDEGALRGSAPDIVTVQGATSAEAGNAVLILLPVLLLILILSSSSWLHPLLYLCAIGISIIINMGTNIIFGEISFMSNSVSPILQLAVSLDYAIFLLHSFADKRREYSDPIIAMQHAIKESLSTVAASALTTLFGFSALTLMSFQIGADLGLTLAKGIVLSFISVMIFLPALTLCLVKLFDKAQHRPLMPDTKNINRFVSKLAAPIAILVVIIVVPSFLGQGQTGFLYGNDSIKASGAGANDKAEIEERFGKSTVMALLVPRGDIAQEYALGEDISDLEHVTGVVSYAHTVELTIPSEFLEKSVTNQFYSQGYARIIAYTNTPEEGDVAFKTVEEITVLAQSYYGDAVYSLGQSSNLYDMKQVVQKDNQFVTIIAAIAIFLVLLGTFRSLSLPFILLLTIEAGIWINLSIPYFTGTRINFIGYLVLNTVQLGATVDYAILLSNTYLRKRRQMPQKQAMHEAMGESFKSILVSAATLATAGFTLYATSSNPAVSDIGLLLGRGTLLSFVMVICFLPAMLRLCDSLIGKTTFRARFFKGKHKQNILSEHSHNIVDKREAEK